MVLRGLNGEAPKQSTLTQNRGGGQDLGSGHPLTATDGQDLPGVATWLPRAQMPGVQAWLCHLLSYVTPGKVLNLSMFRFLHL